MPSESAAEPRPALAPAARFGSVRATDLQEIADLRADPGRLEAGGWWAIVATFEGAVTGYRFADIRDEPAPTPQGRSAIPPMDHALNRGWTGPARTEWRSTMSQRQYRAAVARVRELIAEGTVYQVNLCRTLQAPLPAGADPWALDTILSAGNPAPHAGALVLDDRTFVVSASPELYLARDGERLWSSPIKGTAVDRNSFAPKDSPENIMITDLVRNDLSRVAEAGSVQVSELLGVQDHPGLSHLVSTVHCRLRPGMGWPEIFAAAFPPGSVSGAPKHTALQAIRELEPAPRGAYCGAFGWIDADADRASLAVAIRTFVAPGDGSVSFGTGAGITWDSDPLAEWQETELKAARLIGLASTPDAAGSMRR